MRVTSPRRAGRGYAQLIPVLLSKVIDGIYEGVTTVELDNLAAETAAYKTTTHPDYAVLAARIAISNLHKETRKTFSQVVKDLYDYINPKNNRHSPMISQDVYEAIMENKEQLDSAIIYERDFHYVSSSDPMRSASRLSELWLIRPSA